MIRAKLRKQNNQKGMTLIEVVVSLLVCVIFLTIAAAIVFPTLSNYARIEDDTEVQMILDNLGDTIKGEVSHAGQVSVSGTGLVVDGKAITVEEGYLVINGHREYPAEYYNGRTISMETRDLGDSVVEVELTIYDSKGSLTMTSTYVMSPFSSGE